MRCGARTSSSTSRPASTRRCARFGRRCTTRRTPPPSSRPFQARAIALSRQSRWCQTRPALQWHRTAHGDVANRCERVAAGRGERVGGKSLRLVAVASRTCRGRRHRRRAGGRARDVGVVARRNQGGISCHDCRAALRESQRGSRSGIPGRWTRRRNHRLAWTDSIRNASTSSVVTSMMVYKRTDQVARHDRPGARGRLSRRELRACRRRPAAHHSQVGSCRRSGADVVPRVPIASPGACWACSRS